MFPFTSWFWNDQDCLMVVGIFAVLWGYLQYWLSCWRGHYKYWHSASKTYPAEEFSGRWMLRSGFHLTGFSLNKGLISGAIMRLWHGGLHHTLLQLAAGKELKKRAPCFCCAAGRIVFAFSAASSMASTLYCDSSRENQVTPWLVHGQLSDRLDPRDTGGDAPWLLLTWQASIIFKAGQHVWCKQLDKHSCQQHLL